MHDIKVQKLSCPAYGKHISSSLKKDYFLLYPEWAFGSTGYFVFAGWGFRRAGCGSRIKKVVAGLENGVAPLPYDFRGRRDEHRIPMP